MDFLRKLDFCIQETVLYLDAYPDCRQALEYYRETLAGLTGMTCSDAEFAASLRFNTLEYVVNKLSLLRHACRSLGSSDMELLAAQAARMMELLEIH